MGWWTRSGAFTDQPAPPSYLWWWLSPFFFFFLPKGWFRLFFYQCACLQAMIRSWLGFMLFLSGEVVFPISWCLWRRKCFSAGKKPENVVMCGLMLEQNGRSAPSQVQKGKRKTLQCIFTQHLERSHPCSPARIQINSWKRTLTGPPGSCVRPGGKEGWGSVLMKSFIWITRM